MRTRRNSLNRKRVLKLAVPLAVLLAALGALGLRLAANASASATPAYETAPVTRGRVAAAVTASGTVSPLVTVQVGSQVSGRVAVLNADFNSTVRKGQVIARIDPSLFESQVAQARASESVAVATVAGAEAAVAEARRQYDRTAELVARNLIAQAEKDTNLANLQRAEADLASAKAKLVQARAARAQADTNLAYTTITSPIDGVVISRDVNLGQTVAASLQAPTLFTLAEDLRKMEVHTDVAEADVGRVRPGLPVEFSVDAFPGDRFTGVVKEVRYAPKTVQNVVTYDAVVSVDNSELKLRPGMTADVSFVVEELPDTLLVPNAALRFRPPDAAAPGAPAAQAQAPAGGNGTGVPASSAGAGGRAKANGANAAAAAPGTEGAPRGEGRRGGSRRVVWVLGAGGALRAAPVQVGPTDGKNTAVVRGELAEGERVVTGLAGDAASRGGVRPASGAAGAGGARPGFGRFL
jgi:HlyD family secretion protein